MGRAIRKFVGISFDSHFDRFLSISEAIVVDTGVTLKDIVGFERFEEDLTEFFQFAERTAGYPSHRVDSPWH